MSAASTGAWASLETLGGVLPESLPRSLRLFILVLLLTHILALALWAASVCREVGAGKKVCVYAHACGARCANPQAAAAIAVCL